MRSGLPFVTMKVAMSREGAIARLGTPPGTVLPVTSEASRSRVAALRHRQDAVLTGIGTVLADDPLLTDRSGGRRRRRLLRVVLDSRLRLPLGSRLVATAEDDLLVFTRQEDSAAAAMLRARGVEVLGIGEAGTAGTGSDAGGPGRAESSLPGAAAPGLDLGAVLRELARRGLENVLVEAGTALNTALLNGRHVDRLLVIRSPRDLGGGGIPEFGRLHGPLPLPPPEEGLPDPDSGDAVHDLLLSDPWPAEGM
jgi:diaminohydroxyphosphoribosylaminopyrimidine deaminase/5-amino-6-(5-phosphoribosylamino)uracil reductase